jgi:hypothetical protein
MAIFARDATQIRPDRSGHVFFFLDHRSEQPPFLLRNIDADSGYSPDPLPHRGARKTATSRKR